MDAELLRTKGAQPMNVRMASVFGFELRIGKRPSLTPAPSSCVYGMLMELTHTEILQLYSERSVSAYRPEAVVVDLADGLRIPHSTMAVSIQMKSWTRRFCVAR